MSGGMERTGHDRIELPPGWSVDIQGRKISTFTHADRDLEVTVRAVFTGSKHRTHRKEPSHYVVRLERDPVALRPSDEEDMSAKASTRAEAFEVARSFMDQVTRESV